MHDFISTLLIALIPSVVTGFISYLCACKQANTHIQSLEASNKHEIEKLMKQHEVDIDSLKESHKLDTEKLEQEHRYKIELLEIKHKNDLESKEKEQSNAAMLNLFGNWFSDPQKLKSLIDLADDPRFKKKE